MEEQWINDLRKKMASHQTPVPPGLWEGIESRLPQKQPAPVVPLRKKVILWASGIGSVAAVLALAFFFLEKEMPVPLPPSPALSESRDAGRTAPSSVADIENRGALALNSSVTSTAAPRSQQLQSATTFRAATPGHKAPTSIAVPETEDSLSTVALPPQSTGTDKETEKTVRPKTAVSSFRQTADARASDFLAKASSPRRKTWSINLYTANLPHTAHRTEGYSEFVAGTALPQKNSVAQTPAKELIYSNLGKEINTTKKHKVPIKLGISARYYVTPRLSLESGLTYTFLSSKLTSGTADHHFITHQHLQYLGIPLRVGYDVWKNKRWNFYVSGGGALEKCIHGKSDTDFILSHQLVSSSEKSVKERPLQWSLLGSLGAQLHLSSHFAFYAEPGVSYYFDNGSPVETIYKDQPFNFNFKLGFRIHLN